MRLTRKQIDRVAHRQQGAVSVRQLLGLGADRSWIRRQIAAGRWQRTFPGVAVTHSGPISWDARAWSAVLYAGRGAALGYESAARALRIRLSDPALITVCIPTDRRVVAQPGLTIRHRSTMPALTGGLPIINRADTAVDLVSSAHTVDDAISWLCDAIRSGVSPERVLTAAHRRPRLARRALLEDLVQATADGVESALELRYGVDVEIAHGLPTSTLQVRERIGDRWTRADRVYEEFGLRVELDGALAHPFGRTDADTWRDNEVLVAVGEITLRLRWRHVAATPCEAALLVARALRARGWAGSPRPCSSTCAVRRGPHPPVHRGSRPRSVASLNS